MILEQTPGKREAGSPEAYGRRLFQAREQNGQRLWGRLMPGGFKERPADRVAERSKREEDDTGQFPGARARTALWVIVRTLASARVTWGTLEHYEQREDTTSFAFLQELSLLGVE